MCSRLKKTKRAASFGANRTQHVEDQEGLLLLSEGEDVSDALVERVEHHTQGERSTYDEAEGVQAVLTHGEEDVTKETKSEERDVHESDDCDARCLGHEILHLFLGGCSSLMTQLYHSNGRACQLHRRTFSWELTGSAPKGLGALTP